MTQRRFITLEGGEGSGKSTQMRHLADRLQSLGHDVVVTREPGGTPFAESLRALLLNASTAPPCALAEAVAFFAARADHVESLIRPALAAGRWVLSDRFTDSTRVYQGVAGGVSAPALATLDTLVVGETQPALTLVLDLDPQTGLSRAAARRSCDNADRFEAETLAFHEDLRTGFLRLVEHDPTRCVLIDAHGSEAEVAEAVWRAVVARFGELEACK